MSAFTSHSFEVYNRALGEFSYVSFVYLSLNYVLFRQKKPGNIVLMTLFDVAENHGFDRNAAKTHFKAALKRKVFQEYEGVVNLFLECKSEPEPESKEGETMECN